jgi:hypothetical protein
MPLDALKKTMIAYDLQCGNGHTFEGWFDGPKAYETQRKKGLIACPVCNDIFVSRLPSSFAIRNSQGDTPKAPPTDGIEIDQLREKIVNYVQTNFDDVGNDFAKEALKMHYGVAEPRNIRGVSSQQEEDTLRKEGIAFFKIPMPATDSDA